MRIRTLNKKRKIKAREEVLIKYFIKRFRLKRKDILKNTFFINTKYGKEKIYLCVYEKEKEEFNKYLNSCIMKSHKPLRDAVFNNKNSPFGELEHPSMVKNEKKEEL